MSMRFVALAGLVLLSSLLQGCFPNAFSGEKAGVLVAQDRRAEDARRDDREIEARASDLIYRDKKVFIHVNVTSFNRMVLLSGEVPDQATRSELEKTVTEIPLVSGVHNELVVTGNSSLWSRSNDSRLTSSVKMK
ncbi:MAG TPA: BON domain-containing protein, partial [Gallionella sp.]